MKSRKILTILVLALGLILCSAEVSLAKKPMGNGFTYHGRLAQQGQQANGEYDFLCTLWDDPCAVAEANQVGDIWDVNELEVNGGQFRLELDFGSDPNIFNGEMRWLEIGVRAGDLNDPNVYTILEPRVELSPAPYAVSACRITGEKVVKNEHLGDGAVGKEKIANGAVGKEKIENGAVGKEKIENGAVGREKIENGAVGREKIENGAVDANKLGDISGYHLETSYEGYIIRIVNTRTAAGHGIWVESMSEGTGVYGYSHGGKGIHGRSDGSEDNSCGVYGENINPYGGTGVNGYSIKGIGVHGRSDGDISAGDDAIGVYGENINPHGGTGVYGYSAEGRGVHGEGNIGVYGTSEEPGGYAGWFAGNTCIEGQITITGGSPGEGKILTSDADGLASWQTGGASGDNDWEISEDDMYSVPSGNVGIGTTNPTAKLEVAGTILTSGGLLRVDPTIATISPIIQLMSDNTYSKQSLISFWDQGASLWMIGSDLLNENTTNFGIRDVQAGASRLYINSTGNIGIGKNTPGYKLDVNGDIGCVALHESSDERLKTEIRQLTGVLDKLENVRGVSFEWNEMAESVGGQPGEKQIGVVAQEVEAVFPELVSTPSDGYKSVDYTKLTAVLIEAVKELKSENQSLKQRMEALEMTMRDNGLAGVKEVGK